MNSHDYWKRREEEQLRHYITEETEYQKQIDKIYNYMMDQIQKEIDGFYGKYAKAEGITLAEAKKRVSKLDIEAYERKAEKYVENKTFTDEANEEMRLYNATMKINRLELLKANIGLELVDGFDELQKYYDEILTDRALEEFERQAGILGKSVQNNAEAAHAIVNASFHNAKFSDRIWMYQDMLKTELDTLIRQGLIQGKNPRELARHLTKRFGVAKSNAERLMRTELARVQIEAQKQSFERNGYDQYEFIALGGACPICRELDGEHLKVKDMMPGDNAPPLHPLCRCSVAAHMDDDEFEKWLESQSENDEKMKLMDTTDYWSKEAKQELLKDEESLLGRKRETVVVYDADGKYLFTKRGSETEIVFTRKEGKMLKNAIITHNHPSGASFSIQDIKTLKVSGAAELRVVGENCVYYMRPPKEWPEEIQSESDLVNELKKIRTDVRKRYQKLYEDGKINKVERLLLSSEEYNRVFAEKYGLQFGKESFDG